MYAIVTVPLELCDPNAGTVLLAGHAYPCSTPIEYWDIDRKHPAGSVSVAVDLEAPEALEDPAVYACVWGPEADRFIKSLQALGEL